MARNQPKIARFWKREKKKSQLIGNFHRDTKVTWFHSQSPLLTVRSKPWVAALRAKVKQRGRNPQQALPTDVEPGIPKDKKTRSPTTETSRRAEKDRMHHFKYCRTPAYAQRSARPGGLAVMGPWPQTACTPKKQCRKLRALMTNACRQIWKLFRRVQKNER